LNAYNPTEHIAHILKENAMFDKKRFRPAIVMAIMGLLFIVPLATACIGDEFIAFVSTDSAGTVDGVDYTKDDVIAFDGEDWFMVFDGEAHGLTPSKHDIEAVSVPISETVIGDNFHLYMSFYQNKVMVPQVGQVKGQQAIKYTQAISPSTGYTYTLYFDGTDVGLSTTKEKIDGLEVLDEEAAPYITGGDCEALISVSTLGEYSIPAKFTDGYGKVNGDGSDLLVFCATNTGPHTAGYWIGFFSGMEAGMPKNYMDSIAGFFEAFVFTTPGAFAVDNAFGGHSEFYLFIGGFEGPIFSAPEAGLTSFVDAASMMFVEDGGICVDCNKPAPHSMEELTKRLEANKGWHSFGNRGQ
jgi:hypothetical protein